MAKSLLPIVRKGTLDHILEDLKRCEDSQYVTKIVEHLAKENPNITNFIGICAMRTKDRVAVVRCAAMVYKLLQSQAEADRLEEGPYGER